MEFKPEKIIVSISLAFLFYFTQITAFILKISFPFLNFLFFLDSQELV